MHRYYHADHQDFKLQKPNINVKGTIIITTLDTNVPPHTIAYLTTILMNQFSKTPTYLACPTQNKIRIFDFHSGGLAREISVTSFEAVDNLIFISRRLLFANYQSKCLLIDTTDFTCKQIIPFQESIKECVASYPIIACLVTCDNNLTFWNIKTNTVHKRYGRDLNYITSINSKVFATCRAQYMDYLIQIWDYDTRACVQQISRPERMEAFAGFGNTLFVICKDRSWKMYLCEIVPTAGVVVCKREIDTLPEHVSTIYCVNNRKLVIPGYKSGILDVNTLKFSEFMTGSSSKVSVSNGMIFYTTDDVVQVYDGQNLQDLKTFSVMFSGYRIVPPVLNVL